MPGWGEAQSISARVNGAPLAAGLALHVSRMHACFLQALFHFIGNGLDLARIGAAADNKVIGKRARALLQLQYRDLFSLLFLTGADSFKYRLLKMGLLHEIQREQWSQILKDQACCHCKANTARRQNERDLNTYWR